MLSFDCCRESMNPVHVWRWIKYQVEFWRTHPDFFDPDGLAIFVGGQGTGKTLSAVNYLYKVMAAYPSCKLVTNLALSDFPIVTFDAFCKANDFKLPPPDAKEYQDVKAFYWSIYLSQNRVFEFVDNDDFARYGNGEYGMVFLVDEIQLYLNSLESKNINLEVVTQISQQRKQRKHIIATSQVFGRMAKPLREQFSCVVQCKGYFKVLQCNRLLDRDSLESDDSTGTNLSGEVLRKFWWFRSPHMFQRYDTYRVIERGKFVAGEKQKEIYAPAQSVALVPGKEK